MSKKTDFLKLKKEWYGKLKESGFDDIEQDEDNLKFWSCNFNRAGTATARIIAESYYNQASNFLNDFEFENPAEKFIWEQHTKGLSHDTIAKDLKIQNIKTNRTTIGIKIKKLEIVMKDFYNKRESK